MAKINTRHVTTFLNNSYREKPKKSIRGYKIDHKLSGKRVQVYHKDKEAIVVHRGTKGIHDIGTDIKLGLGLKNNARFKHSKKIQKKAEQKYGAGNITTLGHSLGGALAEVSAKKNSKIITFNKAAVPSTVNKKRGKNQTDIRSHGDIISALTKKQKGGQLINITKKSNNPLSEHKTTVLNRIDKNI